MRVLEHGNLKVRKCPECHCKFEFEEKDLHIKENIEAESKAINAPFYAHDWWADIKEGKETYEIVKSIKKNVICPECGQEINVVYSRKLLENHVPEATKLERLVFWKETLKIKGE